MTSITAANAGQLLATSSHASESGIRVKFSWLLVLLALCLFGTGKVNAALLNLPFVTPDITFNNLSVNYNAGSDQLTIDGSGTYFVEFDGGVLNPGASGTYDLNATIDATGVLQGGDISIVGNLFTMGITGDMLVGTLVDFGFDPTNPAVLEFLVDVSSSAIGIHGQAVLLISGLNTNLDFTSNFGGTANLSDNAQAAAVPAPASILLFMLGGVLLRFFRSPRGSQPHLPVNTAE